MAENVSEPVVHEPVPQVPEALVEVAVDAAMFLSQERQQREDMAAASEDTEPVRRSPPKKKAKRLTAAGAAC